MPMSTRSWASAPVLAQCVRPHRRPNRVVGMPPLLGVFRTLVLAVQGIYGILCADRARADGGRRCRAGRDSPRLERRDSRSRAQGQRFPVLRKTRTGRKLQSALGGVVSDRRYPLNRDGSRVRAENRQWTAGAVTLRAEYYRRLPAGVE